MADPKTIEILGALAAGCDPETGEEFEPTHVLRRKQVTKALNDALKALGGAPTKSPRRPIIKSEYFSGALFNRISAKSRHALAERVLQLPMTYPLDQTNSRVVRTEHARSQEPWRAAEQDLLAKVLPNTNDLKFLSIVFQRSEKAIQMEARRLMAERQDLRKALAMEPEPPLQPASVNEEKAKSYSVALIREQHSMAYAPWTTEDDEKLERLFCEGKKPKQLAVVFGRQPSAITSRIKKLELREKYRQ
ncbi:MAG: hypothetical protein JNL52_09020 [Flavobacteriales bacterium]|nr:hypothetical protein [Flavobacteriales bacterium]